MTTEDDFARKIDQNPEDWQTLLVFADWLDDNGDPRARAYRVIAARRMRPYQYTTLSDSVLESEGWWYLTEFAELGEFGEVKPESCRVPVKWFWKTVKAATDHSLTDRSEKDPSRCNASPTCFQAFDALARGFLLLPFSQQVKLTPVTHNPRGWRKKK